MPLIRTGMASKYGVHTKLQNPIGKKIKCLINNCYIDYMLNGNFRYIELNKLYYSKQFHLLFKKNMMWLLVNLKLHI